MLSTHTLSNLDRLSGAPSPLAYRVAMVDEAIGEISGYIAIWGDSKNRDSYGTWFDRNRPPEMALEFLPFPLLYEHGAEPGVGTTIIGSVQRVWFDDTGVAFSGFLNQSHPWFGTIRDRVRRGELATSSGSSSHVADFDDEGRFVSWLMTELSLTDSAAESRMPRVRLVRSNNNYLAYIGTGGERDALSDDQANGAIDPFIVSNGDHPMLPNIVVPEANPAQPQPENARMTLDQMLNPDVAATVTPEMLIMALIESGVPAEDVMAMLQQAQQPAPPASEASSNPAAQPPAPAPLPAPAPQLNQPVPGDTPQARGLNLLRNMLITRSRPQNGSSNELAGIRAELVAIRRNQQQAPPAAGYTPVQPVRGGSGGGGGHISVGEPQRFAHAKLEDLAAAYIFMKQGLPQGTRKRATPDQVVSEEFFRALTYKTAQAIESSKPTPAQDYSVRSGFKMRDGRAIRANEVMQATAAGFGDEWVGDLQGTTLWETIRQDTLIYQRALSLGMDEAELPQGFESESVPLEGSDPSWFVAAGATAVDANSGNATPTFSSSKFGTGEQSLTVAKLSTALFFQHELEEDSIINIAQEANRKIRVSGAEQIEYILLNGDTATAATTNINNIDGTPAAAPSKPSYTLLNGWLKLPLVTNTANSRDAETSLDENDYLATLKLIPAALRQDKRRLLFIVDSDTVIATLTIPTLKTRDVYSEPTIESGAVANLWGIDILETGQMSLANTAGKVAVVTPANNVAGRILLVRPDRWAVRWKRRIQTDVLYDAYADVTRIVAHMRWGMAYRDNEASAVSYNVAQTLQ